CKTFGGTCKTAVDTNKIKRDKSIYCGRSSVVEHQLPKLSVEGSIPFARSNNFNRLRAWAAGRAVCFSRMAAGCLRVWPVINAQTTGGSYQHPTACRRWM